jgi:hypothetical protein
LDGIKKDKNSSDNFQPVIKGIVQQKLRWVKSGSKWVIILIGFQPPFCEPYKSIPSQYATKKKKNP